jgi:hypothetical protein
MNPGDHPSALELAALSQGALSQQALPQGALPPDGPGPATRQHLETCVACRVRAARLRHEHLPGDPDQDAVARILQASSPGPAILASLTTENHAGPPRPGEIWRVGRDEALLAWVRRVFDDAIDVLPVVLDIDLADQESVFLPARSTPLGTPLALLTGIRGHVSPRAMMQRIGFVNAAAAVHEVMTAARQGRPPLGVSVGPPVESDDDQRIEYRQVISDLLADLAPDRWPSPARRAAPGHGDTGREVTAVMELLTENLSFWQSGARVLPMPVHAEAIGDSASLLACARVTYLDTSMVVATLAGQPLDSALDSVSSFPESCLSLARLEPDAAAIAIVGTDDADAHWPAVVVKVADLRTAYETPTGHRVAPRLAREPLPVIDAIVKFLGQQTTAWEVTESVSADIGAVDIRAIAQAAASDAVAGVAAQGRRARIDAKKAAWTSLPGELGTRIASCVTAIMAGEAVGRVLDDLLEQGLAKKGLPAKGRRAGRGQS